MNFGPSLKIERIFLIALLSLFGNRNAQEMPALLESQNRSLADSVSLNRRVVNHAFRKGEWLKFVIRYGPIKAGFAYMEIPDLVIINGRSSFRVRSRAESNDFFSTFYKVRDRVESFIDSVGLFPWRFEKHLREGRYRADVVNTFDQENRVVITRKDTMRVPAYVQDVLSALYYVRTQKLEVGKAIFVDNFADGKNYPLEVKILRMEKVRVKAGQFFCYVVEPILKSTGIFQHKGRLTVWLTRDKTHMPVLMKSEIMIGSIIAELIEFKGINPEKN